MNNYEEQICKAIDIILEKRFSDLKFNKTIFATIIKAKEDGLYELKYQDAVIEAYSLTGIKYKENDNVYVLIQNNDINDKKYIISYAGEIPMPVLDEYLTKHNPTGTGYFSMNQKDGKVPGQYSTALGYNCDAQGYACMAEGIETFTYGNGNHAEGYKTSSVGNREDGSSHAEDASHAEGAYTLANGANSHAEGYRTMANGPKSHAEGFATNASGFYSHSEGIYTTANEISSHAEGYYTKASGERSHAEGDSTIASGFMSHAEGGQTTANGNYGSHAEGYTTIANGNYGSHAEGYWTTASGYYGSHAEGENSLASGTASHAEGYTTRAIGIWSHVEGEMTTASGSSSHAEGCDTLANGEYTHAEGCHTTANEYTSHSEGNYTMALGSRSHVEGEHTTAIGESSHAEGEYTLTRGSGSHAEGWDTIASGNFSHAEGSSTLAGGSNSHAEGSSTLAGGSNSHTEGIGTIASGNNQHVQGKYNIEDTEDKYAHIVGGGEWNDALRDSIRKNIHTIDWNGNAWYAGDVVSTDSNGNQYHLNDLKKSILLTNQNLDDIFATELTNYYANYENLVVGKPEGVYNFSLIASGAEEQGQYFQQLYANDNIYYRISKEKNPCPVDLHHTFVYDTVRDHPEYVPSSSTSAFKIIGKYEATNRPLIEYEFFVKTTDLEHRPFCLYFKDSNKICYYLAKKDTSSGSIYGSYSCFLEGGNQGSYGNTYLNGVVYTTINYTLGNPVVTFYDSKAYESTKIPLYYSDDTENILNYLNTGNKSNALNFRKIEYDWTEWKSITNNTSTTPSAIEISYDDTVTQIGVANVQSAIEYLIENGSSSVTVDTKLDENSDNPIANSTVTKLFKNSFYNSENSSTISDVNISGRSNNYSTEEHKIGTWIDGSDIYEKTYCPIQSSILEEDFSNKVLIDSYGYVKYTTGNILAIGSAYNTLYKNSSNQLVIEGVNGTFDFTYPYNNVTIRYIYI